MKITLTKFKWCNLYFSLFYIPNIVYIKIQSKGCMYVYMITYTKINFNRNDLFKVIIHTYLR